MVHGFFSMVCETVQKATNLSLLILRLKELVIIIGKKEKKSTRELQFTMVNAPYDVDKNRAFRDYAMSMVIETLS